MAQTAEQEKAAIKAMLAEVNEAAEKYFSISKDRALDDVWSTGRADHSHGELVQKAGELMRTIRGPLDSVYLQLENMAEHTAIRMVMEMGVFEALPADGKSITADELAQKLGIDKDVIVRFVRVVCAVGTIKEIGVEEYAHTPRSDIYTIPPVKAAFKLIHDEYLPGMALSHLWYPQNSWKNATSQENNPFTFAHRTNGVSMWDTWEQHPARKENFNLAMQAQIAGMAQIGVYPFTERINGSIQDDSKVAFVDIGGGKGHTITNIKKHNPDIKGRWVLQELPQLVRVADECPGIEKMEYDFFSGSNPVKGAAAYYMRRVIHDWDDDRCIKILKNTAAAMEPGVSRLLIADQILPSVGAPPLASWYDMTMSTLAGKERTKEEFERILGAAGLRLVKTYQIPGNVEGVVEAELAEKV